MTVALITGASSGLGAAAARRLARVARRAELLEQLAAVRLRDVLPAAVLAAIGFHVASAGFSVYLRHFADFDDVYGSLGAVFGFLIVVYVGAVVLLLGACVAAAWPEAEHPPEPVGGERRPFGRRLADAALGLVVRRKREERGPNDASPG